MGFFIQALVLMICASLTFSISGAKAEMTYAEIAQASDEAVFGAPLISDAAVARLRARGQPDVLPALALVLRYRGGNFALLEAINTLAHANTPMQGWRDLMIWWEGEENLRAHESYRSLKVKLLNRIDRNFQRFIGEEHTKNHQMDIRLSEVVWGGVSVDGIPSLDFPKMTPSLEADYLSDNDLVFGISINGDARAYPLRILGWHEMMNDIVGGVPVALAYCTLCGSAILFKTGIKGRENPLVFGSSGLLYRSNKLMFDRETDSLWNQFTGRPISGPLRETGIELQVLASTTTTWKQWKNRHPKSSVLSLNTGFDRDYDEGVVYREYFEDKDLMFPAIVGDESIARRKDFVFGIRDAGQARAWPLAAFAKTPVINDTIGSRSVLLIGDPEMRTVRAYDRAEQTFTATSSTDRVLSGGEEWTVTEDALIGPKNQRFDRIPGRLAFWFAWDGYFGNQSSIYSSHK